MAKVITTHNKYRSVIVSKTDMRKLKTGLRMKMQVLAQHIIKQLSYIGEECVKTARENGSYNDITGNLRSSIGYVVLHDGKPVKQGGFQQVHGRGENMSLVRFKTKSGKEVKYWAKGESGDGSKGVQTGQKLLQKLQAKFPWGIALIVCAGMNYAAYVESIHHKDVLTSAELRAEELAKKLLKGLTEAK